MEVGNSLHPAGHVDSTWHFSGGLFLIVVVSEHEAQQQAWHDDYRRCPAWRSGCRRSWGTPAFQAGRGGGCPVPCRGPGAACVRARRGGCRQAAWPPSPSRYCWRCRRRRRPAGDEGDESEDRPACPGVSRRWERAMSGLCKRVWSDTDENVSTVSMGVGWGTRFRIAIKNYLMSMSFMNKLLFLWIYCCYYY